MNVKITSGIKNKLFLFTLPEVIIPPITLFVNINRKIFVIFSIKVLIFAEEFTIMFIAKQDNMVRG